MRRKYPRNRDIEESILRVLSQVLVLHPDELPSTVITDLESRGFNTTFVSIKRIWRIYRDMVLKGKIYDVLHVLRENSRENVQ
ncbi:MAG: hypothetical protein DRJ49_01575 [Thermoprotei archaeon]|nr:MAG: hypothetical protein DRN53_06860 [Thermoprotei archaeon]RLE89883.1 MAG: hypothetical protein DRJ49_01575 [Thermoprotei archaeon]